MNKLLSLILLCQVYGLQAAQAQLTWNGKPLEELMFVGFPYQQKEKAIISPFITEKLKKQIIFNRMKNSTEFVVIPAELKNNGSELGKFIASVLNLRSSTYYHPDDTKSIFSETSSEINAAVRDFTLGNAQKFIHDAPSNHFGSGIFRRTYFIMDQSQVQSQPVAAAAVDEDDAGFWHGKPVKTLMLEDGNPAMPKANIEYVSEPLKEQIVFGRLYNENEEIEIPDEVYSGGFLNGTKLTNFIKSVLNLT